MYFEFHPKEKITAKYSELNIGDMFRDEYNDGIFIKINDEMSLNVYYDCLNHGFENRQNDIMEVIDYKIFIYSEE